MLNRGGKVVRGGFRRCWILSAREHCLVYIFDGNLVQCVMVRLGRWCGGLNPSDDRSKNWERLLVKGRGREKSRKWK